MNVPLSALLTTDLVPQDYKEGHTGITVHGLLASYLTSRKYHCAEWCATWPSMEQLQDSMPVLWQAQTLDMEFESSALADIPLPPDIGGLWMSAGISFEQRNAALSSCLRSKQQMKIRKDWMIAKQALPHATYKDYAYNWLIINTRSLYYDLPTLWKPQTRDDRMCLCPFVDYFNHADEEGVSFTPISMLHEANMPVPCNFRWSEWVYGDQSTGLWYLQILFRASRQ